MGRSWRRSFDLTTSGHLAEVSTIPNWHARWALYHTFRSNVSKIFHLPRSMYEYIYTHTFHLSFCPIYIIILKRTLLQSLYSFPNYWFALLAQLRLIYTPYFIATLSFHLLGKLSICTTYATILLSRLLFSPPLSYSSCLNIILLFYLLTGLPVVFRLNATVPFHFFFSTHALTAALFVQLFLSLLFQRLKFSPMLEYLTPFNPSIWLAKWCDILLA